MHSWATSINGGGSHFKERKDEGLGTCYEDVSKDVNILNIITRSELRESCHALQEFISLVQKLQKTPIINAKRVLDLLCNFKKLSASKTT